MLISGFLRKTEEKLSSSRKAIIDEIGEGRCGTYETYQNKVGHAAGIEEAIFIIRDTLTKMNEEEHDE